MDQLNTLSARELSNLNIQGIKVSEPYGTLLGEPERNAVMFIWGEKGAGKSTFSLGLANALADHGRVEYIPAEEHFGKTLVDRVKRLNATHKNLNFTKWKSLEALKDTLRKNRTAFCVLDSITVIEANDKATVELAQWCRETGISFIMVAHATKDGKYKGNTSIAHECDIEIKVTKDGQAEAEKNRYRTLTAIDVPFTATGKKAIRKNPADVKTLSQKQFEAVEDALSNDEISSDQELKEHFQKEFGLTESQASHWVSKRSRYLTNPFHSEHRANPVEVPFRITLSDIDKLHKVRSWKRANSMFGSKMPCYAKAHSGESESAHLSIRYTPDYNNKKYVLELLLDGRLETQICTEGASGGFKASWRQLVKEYGDLEVMIYSQDHAKKVLGAKEYKRQERKFKKAQKTGNDCPPEQASKSSEKLTDKIKRYNLPEEHRDYFDFPNGTQLVPLEKLVSNKKNPEKSIENALGFMKRAASGDQKKRAPIQVQKKGSQYLIKDGNATTEVAKRSGWKKIPVIVESTPAKTKRKPAKRKKTPPKTKGIDIEAARKSQNKLDAFLEKVLS
jgi:hypothetical protein